jgi:hypothetical protein
MPETKTNHMSYVKVATRKSPTPQPEILAKFTESKSAPYQCNCCEYIGKTFQAINMHWNRRHGAIECPGQKPTIDELHSSGLSPFDYKTKEEEMMEKQVKTKRPYNKRQPVQPEQEARSTRQTNFCPCCGLNLVGINYALSTRQ